MKTQTIWIGLACVGWIALGWSIYQRAQDSAGVPGAGNRFRASTVSTNGASRTSICRTTTGETVWEEWDYSTSRINPDATVFPYGGNYVATVFKSPGESPSVEFTFLGADGKPLERWMSQPGGKTWDERINFAGGKSPLERFVVVDGRWTPVTMRDDKRCLLINGDWVQLAYTNGSWARLDRM